MLERRRLVSRRQQVVRPGDDDAQRRRRLFADHARNFVRRAIEQTIRPVTAQQLVQKHAERIHIRRWRDRRALHLLRRSILRRHQAHRGRGWIVGDVAREIRVQKFRDAKVEQLRHAFAGHQDVRRLDVAMHDLFLVRVVNGVANTAKQFQPVGDAQLAVVAVLVEGLAAFDELHHKVRQPIVRRPAVQQSRNVRMIERRQDLPFFAKAPQDKVRIHAALDQLDRDALAELCHADGFVDRAHAAAANLAHNLVRAEPLAEQRIDILTEWVKPLGFDLSRNQVFERVVARFVTREQTDDFFF